MGCSHSAQSQASSPRTMAEQTMARRRSKEGSYLLSLPTYSRLYDPIAENLQQLNESSIHMNISRKATASLVTGGYGETSIAPRRGRASSPTAEWRLAENGQVSSIYLILHLAFLSFSSSSIISSYYIVFRKETYQQMVFLRWILKTSAKQVGEFKIIANIYCHLIISHCIVCTSQHITIYQHNISQILTYTLNSPHLTWQMKKRWKKLDRNGDKLPLHLLIKTKSGCSLRTLISSTSKKLKSWLSF